jgi:hypothetical protein
VIVGETTPQAAAWRGEFGARYTDRTILSVEELDALYVERLGHSRSALNHRFLGDLDHAMRILEVGANVGTQLACLRRMGFSSLQGIELQEYAVRRSRARTPEI